MTQSNDLLTLDDQHFFAEGQGRRVFRHPDRPDLVIKIQKVRKQKKFYALRRLISRNKRRYQPILFSWIEIDEYAAIAARTGEAPAFCAQFRGFASTNKGLGSLFDLVLAPDGSVAPTLATFASRHPRTAQITQAIDHFWNEVDRFGAVVWDSHLKNILVAGTLETGIRLVLVDGLGDRTYIPIRSLARTIRERKSGETREKMKQDYDASASTR